MKQLTRTGALALLVAVLLVVGALPTYAQLSTSKSSITFTSIIAKTTSKADSFYVRNSSQLGYFINGITTGTSRFTATGPTGVIADSIKVRVTFTPDGAGVFTDTVFIAHTAPGALLKVVLSGTGVSGIVLASPRTGGTLTTFSVTDTFATHVRVDSLTIRNTTATAFTISAMSIANKEFTVLTPLPITVNAADSQQVKINYQGTSVGRDRDTLFITHNLPVTGSSPVKLPVTGRAISHELFYLMSTDVINTTGRVRVLDNFDTLRVTAASFGAANGSYDPKVPVDSARIGSVGLVNPRDTVWVTVDSVKFTGPHFRSTTVTPFVHRPGDNYDRLLTYIYRPKDVSLVHRDTIVVYSNDITPTGNRITLLVEGASRRATYVRNTANGTSLTYGTLGQGTFVDSTMRIHNFQDVALRIDSIRFALRNPKYEIRTSTGGFSVNRGDTSKVVIRFTALDTVSTNLSGNMIDTVLVYSDGPTSPMKLPLTAKATATIVFVPSATAINFGTWSVGLFKDSTIMVYNRTTTNYRFDSVSVYSGKEYSVQSNSLATYFAAGDSIAVKVRFKPLLSGPSRDTLYIWHSFAALLANPRKVVLTGTGTTNAFIDPSTYVTVDNIRGPDQFPLSSPDSSYVETTINGFFTNAAALDYGGTATGHRRSPNLAGSPSGSSARYTFKIDSTAPHLIYHYANNSPNYGGGYYVHLRKFGVGGIVDSLRYDERSNFTNFSPEGGGSWFPLMMHRIDGVGPRAASITIGADNLSGSFMRLDAVRFLRSNQKADIEFGRRSLNFNPIRVPEEFGQTTIGTQANRQFRLYNLGRDTLKISDIKIYPTQNPIPWFIMSNYTGGQLAIPPMTTGSDGKEKDGFFDLALSFAPYQEGVGRDSMVISSNDENEPKAYIILHGEGLNINFIMNASAGNTEPHYGAPAPPDVPVQPIYRESPGFANSTASPIITPITGTNLSSRVNTGGSASFPHQAWYEFQLPEIFRGRPTDGRYLLEYGGPSGSSNAYTNTLVKVTHTFGVPPDSTNFNSQTDRLPGSAYPYYIPIGGTTKTWFLAPGGLISIQFRRDAQTDAGGGAGFLRIDLLRIRKVPTGALIGVSVASGSNVNFGDVSFRSPAGLDGKANRKEISLGSRGESQVIVKSLKFRDGKYFTVSGAPSLPIYMRALVGEQKLSLVFTPDRISPSFVDTLEVLSNSSSRDSVLLVPVMGNGIGGIYTIDDDGTFQEVSSTPAFGGLYIGGWDKAKMNNWQVETSNTPDDIGKGRTRHLLPIYFNAKATFEWYPAIPADPTAGDSVLMNVAVTVPRGFTKGSPGARYRVYSTGGNLTKDTVINQNNPPNTGASNVVEINLGNHYFLRGGRDVPGGQAFFGHVQLFNDTTAVSAFYGTLTNFARRDTFALLADAVILRELDRLRPTVTAVNADVPLEFALSQNYPNPFNPSTTIEFSLARAVPVELKIYDMLGREVAVLLQSNSVNPGRYLYRWDGKNRFGQSVATGVYFYRLVAGDFVKTNKMMLIK